jgi:phage gp46-like protein
LAFTRVGRDLALTNQDKATGLLSFDWGTDGEPKFDDTEAHRVLSLLVEHRPSPPSNPGYWADATGKRGSLLYTLTEVKRATPSQAEGYAVDALQKAVDDNAILLDPANVTAKRTANGMSLSVIYTANGDTQRVVRNLDS